ncbi:uncharacterized protein [Narcine bancroftii]|uniref:uncharacterized protein n=1 Tax=Narcine bancroftii TaxID=1343680 RepID=UPI0038310894
MVIWKGEEAKLSTYHRSCRPQEVRFSVFCSQLVILISTADEKWRLSAHLLGDCPWGSISSPDNADPALGSSPSPDGADSPRGPVPPLMVLTPFGEVARRLQEEEEELRNPRKLTLEAEVYGAGQEALQREAKLWCGQEGTSLDRKVAELNIRDSSSGDEEQLQRDEALAQLLQEEEELRMVQLKSRSERNQEEDFRTAQVAQDEEIARYIQRQELKAHRQSKEHKNGYPGDRKDPPARCEKWSRLGSSQQERLKSEGFPSPSGEQTPVRGASPTEQFQQARYLFPRNIAEDLDPTFKAKSAGCSSGSLRPVPPGLPRSLAVPPDGFFDCLDESSEPMFVPPTRRQDEKLVRQKSKEKKEGCKQQ